jgi:hypothetical protein
MFRLLLELWHSYRLTESVACLTVYRHIESVARVMGYRHVESIFELWVTDILRVFLSYGLRAY